MTFFYIPVVSGGIWVSWPAGPEPAPSLPESANGPWPMVWIIGGIFISNDSEIILQDIGLGHSKCLRKGNFKEFLPDYKSSHISVPRSKIKENKCTLFHSTLNFDLSKVHLIF